MSEIQNPIHVELGSIISGKLGIICESVHSEFKELVLMCGGPNEKFRADQLLKHLTWVSWLVYIFLEVFDLQQFWKEIDMHIIKSTLSSNIFEIIIIDFFVRMIFVSILGRFLYVRAKRTDY